MTLLGDLEEIRRQVAPDPRRVSPETRHAFWRLVGKIKRMPAPSEAVIQQAAAIRDLLYEARLGRPRALRWLVFWFTFGTLGVILYLWWVRFGGALTGNLLYDLVFVLGFRGSLVAAVVFLYYPFGRLLAGRLLRIQLDGITRDIYYLPTLRINYVTYLRASPPRRQWFFVIAGYWTAFTAFWLGLVGFVLGGEWLGLALGVVLGLLETVGAIIGGKWGGELGHFHRERRIVRDWKRAQRARRRGGS